MSYAVASPSPSPGAIAQRVGTGPQSTLQKKPVATAAPKYQLEDAASDWSAILNIRRQFDQNVTLIVDQFYRQRDPDTPYFNVPDRDGVTNLAKQVTDPTLTFMVDKTTAYNLSGDMAVHCPADRNAASARNLRLCEDLISFTLAYNEERAPTHFSHHILHNMLMLTGMAPLELHYESEATNPQGQYGGYPIKLTLHDPLAVAYLYDPDGSLSRVIVAKRVQVGELLPAWKKGSLSTRPDTDEVILFQDWNKVNFGAVVEGDIVAQYPHGYVDPWGNGFVPFIIGMHQPMIVRLGDVPPQLTYGSPRVIRVGRSPFMGLIGTLNNRSFLMTTQRYNIRENVAPWYVETGAVDVDHDSKTARIKEVGGGDWKMEEAPNVLENIAQGLDLTSKLIESGGASSTVMSGVTPNQASGVAVQGGTAMPKAMMEAVRRTHEQIIGQAGCMMLWMVGSNTQASEPRAFKADTGMDLHPSVISQVVQGRPTDGVRQPPEPGQHPLDARVVNNGAMQFYEWVTGDPRVPIDDLTVTGVNRVECGITPMDALPKETRMQMFTNMVQSEGQTGKKALTDDMLYGDVLGVSNPQAFMARIATDEMLADPACPVRKFTALRNIAQDRLASDAANAPFWQNALTQLDTNEDQAIMTWYTQQVAALAQGGGGQPQAAPGPAAPPGAPQPGAPPGPFVPGQPPGGPTPLGPPPAPPPQGPVGGPPMPNGPPQGGPPQLQQGVSPLGGNPAMQAVA